jgi:membrane-associated phospholipid phosphatase
MRLLKDIHLQTKQIKETTLYQLIWAVAGFIFITTVFGVIADAVIDGDTQMVDEQILLAINSISSPLLNYIITVITFFGGFAFVLLVTCAIAVFFARRHKWRPAIFAAFAVGGVGVSNSILKLIFQRDRPDLWEWVISESTYSFPSGHSALSFALALTCIILMWHTRWRWLVLVVGAIYVLTIGFTRLYLGVHYPTDVAAGWIVASLWVTIVALILGIIRSPQKPISS